MVEIVTPKKIILNGLWFGPAKPKRVIVWVHGLGSSMFSKLGIVDELVDKKTAVLMFNNRGHSKVVSVATTKGKGILAGSAHEKFIDCADDIQGVVNFVRRRGVKNVFLVGHSTGCQKSMFWGHKKGKGVKSIVLLAPIDDRSAEVHVRGKKKVEELLTRARELMGSGKRTHLVSQGTDSNLFNAQRYISLCSGKGPEAMFSYAQAKGSSQIVRSVRLPILAVFAEDDEFGDRPAKDIATWFQNNMQNGRTLIVPRVPHSFKGGEKKVAAHIRSFTGGE
ncbi:MAG: alpha/beta fold hydrolase [Patescibacteria group bacterium]